MTHLSARLTPEGSRFAGVGGDGVFGPATHRRHCETPRSTGGGR